LYEERCVM